jgi:hypothetical protein
LTSYFSEPGGHLQWVEHDKASSVATTAIPGQSNEAAQAYVNLQKMPFPNYNFQYVREEYNPKNFA